MNTSEGTCANCGKGEEASINLKTCTACKLVKYCSRDCQITHRSQHKKECKKRAAELRDEKLFADPPPPEECPICMIRLPSLESGSVYMTCCGKGICRGCIYTVQSRAVKEEDDLCPFCRTPGIKYDEEMVKRYEKRIEMNDKNAMYNLGYLYSKGMFGLPQDHAKALELLHRAGELGSASAYYGIGIAYYDGIGVEVDLKKAAHYWGLAAMGGHAYASCNLGAYEVKKGNMERALKHLMFAAKEGDSDSLKNIKVLYSEGLATKDDYAKALRSYQAYLEEIRSDQRDEAAAFRDDYKYYESGF